MTNVFEVVTNRIIEELEKGVITWRKPWKVGFGATRSLISQKSYRGINMLITATQEYESPYWLSYKQAIELNSRVRKGEKGTPILYYEIRAEDDKATGEVSRIPIAKYFTVFNVAQVEGLSIAPDLLFPDSQRLNNKPNDTIDTWVQSLENYSIRVSHGFKRAAYCANSDIVMLPRMETFDSSDEYYSTLFHELIHASGHISRLARTSVVKGDVFGSDDYSREELVAEIGAAMLCSYFGVSNQVIANQSAYISNWLKVLRADNRALIVASAHAQKACELFLNEHLLSKDVGESLVTQRK